MKLLKRTMSRALTEAYSLGRRSAPSGLRVLMYHAVGSSLEVDTLGLSIDPKLFEAQMRFLKNEADFKIVALAPASLEASSPRRIAVTFDDGYRDNLTTAAPILARLAIPFTVFAVPAYLRSGKAQYLDWAGLKDLAAVPGCQIGSHGLNHFALDRLSPKEALSELADSRKKLEDALGRPVLTVSYPFGRANPRVRQAAAAAGYHLGCCSRTGVNAPDRDPLMLCRTEIVAHDGLRSFKQKFRGGWDWHGLRHKDPARE